MIGDYSESSYWDYISTLDQAEPRDTIRELVKDAYPLFLTYLEELYFIEANVIFLNLVHEIPQQEIASVIMRGGISQMGVSKRVNSGMRKIKTFLKRPEINKNKIRQDLKKLLPQRLSTVVQLYYFFKTYALVSEILGLSTSGIRNRVIQAVDILQKISNIKTKSEVEIINRRFNLSIDSENITEISELASRYYEYLNLLVNTYNSGDYQFNGKLFTDESLEEYSDD